jgi:PAS domain S-box-containing protein
VGKSGADIVVSSRAHLQRLREGRLDDLSNYVPKSLELIQRSRQLLRDIEELEVQQWRGVEASEPTFRLALEESTQRLADSTAQVADLWLTFDEQARAGVRPNDAPRLRKMIEEANVDALFERMWLASIVEASDDAIISKNLDGIITSWNNGAVRLFGYLAEEIIGKSVTILIPQERQHEEAMILERIRSGARIEHFETVRQRKDGSCVEISLTVSPIKGAAGKVVGASRIARDITERKRSEAQISILAREAEHRAKNLLANVAAMVDLSQADTTKGLKEAIKGRIAALANVHSLFARSRWAGAELGCLVERELSPYCQGGEMRTQIHGPSVMLNPDVAQSMAMTLHELATNAAKYGALSVAEGQVRVEWSRAEDRQLMFRWAEAGGPPAKPPARKGFGTRLIESMIRGGAKGRLQLDWRAEGLVCEITVPT